MNVAHATFLHMGKCDQFSGITLYPAATQPCRDSEFGQIAKLGATTLEASKVLKMDFKSINCRKGIPLETAKLAASSTKCDRNGCRGGLVDLLQYLGKKYKKSLILGYNFPRHHTTVIRDMNKSILWFRGPQPFFRKAYLPCSLVNHPVIFYEGKIREKSQQERDRETIRD